MQLAELPFASSRSETIAREHEMGGVGWGA